VKKKSEIFHFKLLTSLSKSGILGFILFFLLILPYKASFATCGDPSPAMNCASVSANGDVTLKWLTPANTGSFDSYQIFTSSSLAGPYMVLDSIFVALKTSYTHVGAKANIAPVYYFIKTRCNGSVLSPALDTIQTLFLNVTNPANGTALLSWNPMKADTITKYSIYQEYPTNVWAITGKKNNPAKSSVNLNFIDTIFICNSQINYRVETSDKSGCISKSSVSGGVFRNTIVPAVPLFDTMSVDTSNRALMSWKVSSSSDVAGYAIYKFNGASWIAVDSVTGINSKSFTYLSSNAGAVSEQYRLAAYDSCGNISPQGGVFSTIHLSATADICSRSAKLNWSAYTNFNSGVGKYMIFQGTGGLTGAYTIIGSVSASTLTFTATGLAPNINYNYKIQAVDITGTKTVSSNRIVFYSATPVPPKFIYIQKVSAVGSNQVELLCHIDITARSKKYKIMRSLDTIAANFIQIGTVSASISTPILFTDNKAEVGSNSYYYKVINVDSCGNDGLISNIAKTVLLSVKSNENLTNTLTWNDYEFWSGGVQSYTIYRQIDGVSAPIQIGTVSYSASGINTYTDDISQILQGQGVFTYYIEANEGAGGVYNFTENSISNTAKGYQDAKIFFPNAFTPNGNYINDEFKPVALYVDFTDYQFRVFNRMGLQMFYSQNLNDGWDGTFKGRECENGVFVYMCRYKSSNGEYKDISGSVILMR
jgi:gliding motility-associated-like protein